MNDTEAMARKIFLMAIDLPQTEDVDAFVKQQCPNNDAVLSRVRALLEAHSKALNFLDQTTCSEPALVGLNIGCYKLLEVIGEGGMGVVYMAEQTSPIKRRVALKVIKPGMDSRQVVARFEAERQALALMDHPNIAGILDAGTTDKGLPYFVMELVRGVPITEYCDQKQLPTQERLELFASVCDAVQHAHQKGIIHRDLKPSNVLVAQYDGRPVPKIIDFGVSKAVNCNLTNQTLFTRFGQIIGTIEYMSPEQAELNQLDIDTRSDVYSLGVLLYELLTGEPPFARDQLRSAAFGELLRIIREVEPPRPSNKLSSSSRLPALAANRQIEPRRLSAMVRGELDWIVMKTLEKERSRRYDSASELAADVQRFLAKEPVSACPPTTLYRFRKLIRRNRTAAVLLALFLLTLIGGIFGTSTALVWALNEQSRVVDQANSASNAIRDANQIIIDTVQQLALESEEEPRAQILPGNMTPEFEGLEVEMLAISAKNAAILYSQSLRDETRARQTADAKITELDREIEFLVQQLAGVDLQVVGSNLRDNLMDRVRRRAPDRDSTARSSDHLDALKRELETIDFAELARLILMEDVLTPFLRSAELDLDGHPQTQKEISTKLRKIMANYATIE